MKKSNGICPKCGYDCKKRKEFAKYYPTAIKWRCKCGYNWIEKNDI